MVESTRLTVTLLLVALASTASVALRPPKLDSKADPPTTPQRLLRTVIPSEYSIELTPNLETQEFTGIVTIKAKVQGDGTKEVQFHAAETLILTSGSVMLDPTNASSTEDLEIATVNNILDMRTATWTTDALKEQEIILTITYNGSLSTDMDGFYISTYEDNEEIKYLASTQFESVSARKAFPCLDEPDLKAIFNMKITVNETYGVLFNTNEKNKPCGEELGETQLFDNCRVQLRLSQLFSAPDERDKDPRNVVCDTPPTEHNFEPTPIMSTYLVAFVIYDISTFTNHTSNTQSVWSRSELGDQRQLAFDAGSQCLNKYSAMFGIDYFNKMINKMDQIAIPDFSAGAMENWGLVTYRESELLGDPDKTSTSDKRNIIETVAHEFAHQWFGDLVSPNYWDVLWLNEGFATYWMYHVEIDLYKDFNMPNSFVAIDMETALEADAYDTTHAMTYPLEGNDAFEGKFDDITYEKAGSVIRMMKFILGEPAFTDGLTKYLNTKTHQAALPTDLFENLKPQDDKNFVNIMLSWSNNPGYPVVNVIRNYEGNNSASLTQVRFYLMSNQTEDNETPWITPISYSNDLKTDNTTIDQWLEGNATLVIENLSDDVPLIVNLQRAGFYRVNYDPANWELIASQLQSDHSKVDQVTRAALVSDAFSMARAGLLDYSVALDLSTYLINEVEYVPWEAAFRHLSFLNTRLSNTTTYNDFKKYMASLVKKSYDDTTFQIDSKDTSEKRIHRENVLLWACKIELPDCSEKAMEKLESQTNETILEPDVRGVVLCEGVRNNESLWDILQQEFLATTSATDKLVILKALGCSQKTDILLDLLAMARDPQQVRPQDIATAYAAVYNNPIGVDLALDDINNNTASLVQQFSGLQRIFSGLGDKITSDDQISKLEKLGAAELGNAKSAYEAALTKAKANRDWLTKNEKPISDWLVKYNSAASASASILLLAIAAVFTFLNH